jgi:hypothetical protein
MAREATKVAGPSTRTFSRDGKNHGWDDKIDKYLQEAWRPKVSRRA